MMNHGISILFRMIPVVMALVCFVWGGFVFILGNDVSREGTGLVLFFLGAFSLALYAIASVIVRQFIHKFRPVFRYIVPLLGYVIAFFTLVFGIYSFIYPGSISFFIAGHIVAGIGLVIGCVACVAAAAVKFYLIPVNSNSVDISLNSAGFSVFTERGLTGLPLFFTLAAWVWTIVLLSRTETEIFYFVAGSVMGGLACVCTCLMALATTLVRQTRNGYSERDRRNWPKLSAFMGWVCLVWGLIIILAMRGTVVYTTGYVMVGLGLVCFGIFGQVLLMAKTWRRRYSLAGRVQMIPVIAALLCLLLGAFLFEMAYFYIGFLAAGRTLIALGTVCFSLFSIANVLENGISKK